MESILSYLDYRQYLKDYYAYKKATMKHFSYRYFSQKAGVKSPVFLKEIYDGKKNLTQAMVEKFITYFNFRTDEANYFRILVQFNQAATVESKKQYLVLLEKQLKYVEQFYLDDVGLIVFEKWYTLVIRELITQKGYHKDTELLAKQLFPPISKQEAEEAIHILMKYGFVQMDGRGNYVQHKRAISSGSVVASQLTRNHNKQMLEFAKDTIESVSVDKRYCKGLTVGINQECYEYLIKEIEAFKDRLVSIVDGCEEADEVYEFYLQLFPLSQKSNWKEQNND